MRYHVISLVAVFLALGIGILLGTTLVERGLIAEQRSEISSLKNTFEDIKAKNSSLHNDLNAYTRYAAESRPYMVTNMLPGKTYAVVTTRNPENTTLSGIADGLAAAGASAPVTITISGQDVFNNQATVANLATLFQMGPDPVLLKDRVFAEIVNQLSTASNTGILVTMQQLGVIQVHGALTAPVAGAILLGPIEEGALDKTDVPLIKAFVATGFPVVGVSGTSSEPAVLTLYKKNGISTVDHVETVPGQVALDMSLAGKPWNYGSGPEATRMIPAP
ncbi:MAG: copper transporter [Candidatus Geothermincolia bacterium]